MNIFITGGASGLGEAIIEQLATKGEHSIYFTYSKSAAKASQLAARLPNVFAVKCNFTNPEECKKAAERIVTADIDVLIHNAWVGDPLGGHFHKTQPEQFSQSFSDNILPVIMLTREAIHHFRKKKSGKILTILTSYLLNTPPAGTSVYTATKAYLAQLAKSWAAENDRYQIVSNTISPSFMLTPLTSGTDERLLENMKDHHPYRKLLTVEEVARVINFMVEATPHMNGIDIPLHAGMNMR